MLKSTASIPSSIADTLTCIVCMGVLFDPVRLQRCEHYFCRGCITKWLEQHKTCPIDREYALTTYINEPCRILVSILDVVRMNLDPEPVSWNPAPIPPLPPSGPSTASVPNSLRRAFIAVQNFTSIQRTIPINENPLQPNTQRQRPQFSHPKPCGHMCSLSASIPSCCFCIDNRPHHMSYRHYIDGRGFQLGAMRSADYCIVFRNRREPLRNSDFD
ncbi:hypothetical protein BCR33DRAFT_532296 [Rhizoclosmatium globosum]|uniref:RING-type domain-containing protein n=1 Tax=Rhizoclosmatium globosum TaxID=329046 RepID=A0A1Y2CUR7_9FUNG|nr:hypothetical protein BCR33DRAFT_532296 [Rhizoclosmatium globosum]|eukprot:ORY50574.1 hypothetical protein BCR33DRAFT_532296 [Rhizoclosmatium globosum]